MSDIKQTGTSYYAKTEEGLELFEDVVEMRAFTTNGYSHEEYQVMWADSIVGEGTFCYDYVRADGDRQELVAFLDRNLDT
jgi:hypothetical protein